MALPTLSTNQPSAGSISWTAFSLTYNGITYPFVAGNTNKKFTWWQYNGGVSPALMGADAIPTLTPDDLLLFLNKNGVGVLVPYADVIDGSLIVSGSILAASIGANQIVTSHIAADAVKAGAIDANAILARNVSAGAITASKLSIGSVGDNMVANGSFEDATEAFSIIEANGTADVVTGVSSSGANALRLVRSATVTGANVAVRQATPFYIPVSGVNGAMWYVSARAGGLANNASGFYLRVFFYTADKVTAATTAFTDIATNSATSTGWGVFEGQVTPPANARYMAIAVYNILVSTTVYVDQIEAYEVIVSAQIGDGAITANKIIAGAIDGKTITGALIRSAASGQRVELTSAGLKGYDAGGVIKTSVGTDGLLTADNATITGILRTGTTGQRAELSSTSAKFYSPSGAASTILASNASDNSALLSLSAGGGSLLVGKVNLPSSGSVGLTAPDAWVNRVLVDQIQNNLGQPLIQVSSLGGVGSPPAGVHPITKIGNWSGAYFSGGTSNQVFDGAFPTKCASIQLTMQGGPHNDVSVYANTLGAAGLTLATPGGYTGNAQIHYTAVGW